MYVSVHTRKFQERHITLDGAVLKKVKIQKINIRSNKNSVKINKNLGTIFTLEKSITFCNQSIFNIRNHHFQNLKHMISL